MTTTIPEVITMLEELQEDTSVPRNVRSKIVDIIQGLQDKKETIMKVSRALHDLEEISEDNNVQSYTRMQLFNVASMLESVH